MKDKAESGKRELYLYLLTDYSLKLYFVFAFGFLLLAVFARSVRREAAAVFVLLLTTHHSPLPIA